MKDLSFLSAHGAELAPDGIPLHFGDIDAEYKAALEDAVLMERSHESRLMMDGRDHLNLLQRISTNDVLSLQQGQGCATILTNPNGRIIDRIMVYRQDEQVLVLTEPGRGDAVHSYLQRQIFFNDDVRLSDLSLSTRLFALHGPAADAVVTAFTGQPLDTLSLIRMEHNSVPVTLTRRKALNGAHWAILVPETAAAAVWSALLAVGQSQGLRPAGSLTYNVLRIRAGRPGVGRELSLDYIPLEAGLWDEVNFHKGCYTGQEIIARMESRGRLAKTLVQLQLTAPVAAPTALYQGDKPVGTLTSSVQAPDGTIYGLGFVKLDFAMPGETVEAGDGHTLARITNFAGAQPPVLQG